jgi:hypothetical protein
MAMTEIPAAVPAPPGCKVNYDKIEKIVKVKRKSWFAWFPFLSLFEL